MRKLRIMQAIFLVGIYATCIFAQNDNTAVNVVWFNDPPDAIGTKWQINVTGATDLDNDGLGEFYVLGQAPGEGDDAATLFQIEASGLDNDFIITPHFSWQNLVSTQRSLGMGDIDADGLPELIAGVNTPEGTPGLYFFEWDPTANSFPTTPTATWDPPRRNGKQRYEIAGPFVTNVDADGNPELIISSVEQLLIVERDGALEDPAGFWTVEFADTTTWERQFGLAIADLDNDGLMEVIDGAAWGSCCPDPGPKPTDFNILETTGEDAYATVVAIHDSLLPPAYGGANGGILVANLDQDANDEIYLADVDGNFWVITPNGNIDTIDSTSFHLLGTFPSTSVAGMVRGDIDADGLPDFYVAGGFSGSVFDVEYLGGDITDPFSYEFFTIFADTNTTNAIAPARLLIGNDMDADNKEELVIVSFANATTRPTVFIIESDFVSPVIANVVCPSTPFVNCPITACVGIDMTGSTELLGSFTAMLTWDPTQLAYVSDSGILSGFTGLVNTDSVAVGKLSFNGASATGVSGVFDVLCVNFDVVGPVSVTGTVSASFSAMSAALTFTDLLSVLNVNNCNYTIAAGGLLGDVSGDGLVNSTDALIILSFDVGLPIPQPFLDLINAGFGDVNADGFTNSTDALIILSFDVGLPVPFPVGQQFCP